MYAVELDNVTKRYGQQLAVDDLSLRVPTGSVYGFIGPNGSGKSTTLRMIMRIIYPNTGDIRVLGGALVGAGQNADRVGYLPEERGLYKIMRVNEILRFFAELKGCSVSSKDIQDWLDRMQLSDCGNKKIDALSKGMAQKIQFIGAVIGNPELIILDEPFTGLDPVNANLLRDIILELQRDGATIILSTHDMSVAEKMCDGIFMIFKGKKVLDGSLNEIQATYGDDTVRVRIDTNGTPIGAAPSDGVQMDGMQVDCVQIDGVPGVASVSDFGQYQELRIEQKADTQDVLANLMKLGRVRHFELARPSLHDIFIRIAGPEGAEAQEKSMGSGSRGSGSMGSDSTDDAGDLQEVSRA